MSDQAGFQLGNIITMKYAYRSSLQGVSIRDAGKGPIRRSRDSFTHCLSINTVEKPQDFWFQIPFCMLCATALNSSSVNAEARAMRIANGVTVMKYILSFRS